MVRARLAVLMVALSLGIVSGCMSSWSCHPLLDSLRGIHENGVSVEGPVGSDGPILGECSPLPGAAINPSGPPSPTPIPRNSVPPLAPAPRLVPQPETKPLQSNPMPYSP